ncbi:MAG: oxidoreductase [Candidatus Marinimicrobia bacterium]|nr:oxidoreductase [Candidatus Neomarinimicrobiota bacterium]|tara:strand:- start:711 stop:1706 length:996 start_codon:yes stop_codon:yes gene_type:complete
MEKKLNIAQIGVGYWGPNLLRNLVGNKDCIVSKVVDKSEERRKFVKDLYPEIEVSECLDTVYSDSEVDAIIVATPVSSHYDLTIKALESDKHVLVEKPMAKTVLEAQKIGNLAKTKNLVAMVGHTFLYNSVVRYIKTLIDSGVLGDIRYIYSQRVNLGRIRNDVDALWNLAPHDISIIQYWLNESEPINMIRNGMDYVQSGIDDVVFMNIEYPDNIMVNIHVSWLDPHKIRRMTVVGSKKMVVYDDIADDKIIIYDKGIDRMAVLGENMDFDNPNTFSFHHRSGEVTIPNIKWEEPLKTEIDHFVDCIQNGTDCLTDAIHAAKVIRILASK